MFLVFVWVFSPVVPVINLPFLNTDIKLGIEVSRAYADPFGNGYTYRRSITINESQVTGSGDLTNFPVLISFTDPTFAVGGGGHVTDSGGDDIIFTSDSAGSSQLSHEVERYNSSTGEVTMWVEVPTLDFDNNTTIYMFYGNSGVTNPTESVAATWDTTYDGVWHMDDSGATNSDSAGTANDGSVSGATAGAAGKFGPAYDFDGVNDVSTVTDANILDYTNTGTIEAWMKTDDVSGAESNFSSWVARPAPAANSAGADDESGIDSVIVGENVHYGAYLCSGTVEDFAIATSTLSGNRFDNWDMSKIAAPSTEATCTDAEGGTVGMDSDGVHIYFAVLANDAGTTEFATATATPSYSSVGAWRDETDPVGGGASDGQGIDMVIVGSTAYYEVILGSNTSDIFASTTRTVGSLTAITWRHGSADTPNFGAGTSDSCMNAVDSDGDLLYRSVYCGADGTGVYNLSSTTVSSISTPTWRSQTAPTGVGTDDYEGMDMVAMGGRLYHALFLHNDATESVQTASSSMALGGAITWISRIDGSSNPNGTAASNAVSIAVASDGKNLYYGALASTTANQFFTASSSLPAHPVVSKRNAYEMIQVGTGFAFDWAGRPYTFGTSTDTTSFKHVVVTQDGATLSMYENGVLRRSQTTSVDFETNTNNLLIGAGNRSDGTSIYFNGIIDEVRVASSTKTADWIQTGYNNQNATSTFYTLGSEETFANAPTVTTGFASDVTTATAVLNGAITSNGGADATQNGFAWGTNGALSGGDTATTTLGGLSGTGSFTSAVASLSADTTYYFRAYATNTGGTGYGVIRSFFTGNATVKRAMMLFEGYKVRLEEGGKMILHQKQ